MRCVILSRRWAKPRKAFRRQGGQLTHSGFHVPIRSSSSCEAFPNYDNQPLSDASRPRMDTEAYPGKGLSLSELVFALNEELKHPVHSPPYVVRSSSGRAIR